MENKRSNRTQRMTYLQAKCSCRSTGEEDEINVATSVACMFSVPPLPC